MPMTMYRLEREPTGAEIRAEEMLHEAIQLVRSTHFALEVAGAGMEVRYEVGAALEHLLDARIINRGAAEA